MTVYLDGECYGTLDLTEVGSPRFWRHPESKITVAAFSRNRGRVQTWVPVSEKIAQDSPAQQGEILFSYLNLADRIVAFGDFERQWIRSVFGMDVTERYDDLQARALYASLPAELDALLEAVKAPFRKDREGHALCKLMAMPAQRAPLRWHWEDDKKLDRLIEYCISDVNPLIWLDDYLPKLPPMERHTWMLDARANDRGIPLDLDAIHAAVDVLEIATAHSLEEWKETIGEEIRSPSCAVALKKWLHSKGYPVKSCAAEILEEWMQSGEVTDPLVQRVLELRKAASRSSVKKLEKMLLMADNDGRVRGSIRWHGAHTGRKSNLGVQFQNLCRATNLEPFLFELLQMVVEGEGVQQIWE